MSAPIIFIHYNDSKYLKYTLQSAVVKNPDKNVYLIGDSSNKHYEKFGVIHHFFSDYLFGKDLEEFESVFQFIVGVEFNNSTYGEQWTRFNFRKWFVLANFLEDNEISNFWIFDSDVLIIEPLKSFENHFAKYDFTTSSGDLYQLFGFVSSSKLIKKFSKSVIDMFRDDLYLEEQRRIMQENPNWGLTMMRAFQRFKKICDINAKYIFNQTEIVPGVLFLDYHREGTARFSKTRGLVSLFLNNKGLFVKVGEDYFRVPLMNMSWMPHYLMRRVYNLTSKKIDEENMESISFKRPLGDKLRSQLSTFYHYFIRHLEL